MLQCTGWFVARWLVVVGLVVGFHATSQAQSVFQAGQTWDIQAAQLNPTEEIVNGFFTVDRLTYDVSDEQAFDSTLHFGGTTLTGTIDDQFGNSLLFLDFRNGDSSWSAQLLSPTGSKFGGQYGFVTPGGVATNGIFVATVGASTVPLPPSIAVFALGMIAIAARFWGRAGRLA